MVPFNESSMPTLTPEAMGLTTEEQVIFSIFCQSHKERKPTYSPADEFHLIAAGFEYIKFIRQTRDELVAGKPASISKQIPLVQVREELRSFYGSDKPTKVVDEGTSPVDFFRK